MVARMSCFWSHKWGKWEAYQEPMYSTLIVRGPCAGQKIDNRLGDFRQKRVCERCGKTQDELVKYA